MRELIAHKINGKLFVEIPEDAIRIYGFEEGDVVEADFFGNDTPKYKAKCDCKMEWFARKKIKIEKCPICGAKITFVKVRK